MMRGPMKIPTMHHGSVDPQILLKITQPRVPRSLLTRSRLSSLNPELSDKSIIVVQAAAGFGKTSLLAQWRREALQTGTLAAWLTLDSRDTDSRVALGLTLAMRAATGKPNFGLACLQAGQRENGALEGITELLAEVAAMATETVIILDEVQSLPQQVASNSLLYLLHNAPANLRIVIATRRPIPLPMGEILARGQFAVLESGELRFELGETLAFLKARFGHRIDSDDCVRLHELTQGWPLGIQLAVATIERSPDLHQAINEFSAHSGDIQRYFIDCLVDGLPSELASFLVRISFIDAISPPLCQAILPDVDTDDLLPKLRDTTPIFSSGVDSEWLQIHPLAREFLMVRFDRLPEEERRELHARAASWLSDNLLYEEGARQALKAGLNEMAYELAENCLHSVISRGQVIRVSDWMERLPIVEIQRRPGLRLAVAWALAQSDQHAEAVTLVRMLVDDLNLAPGERCESTEICATASLFADDFAGVETYVAMLDDTRPTASISQKAISLNLHALLALIRGKPEQVRFILSKYPNSSLIGAYPLAWRDWLIGCSYLWEGQIHLGAQVLRSALARAEEASGRRSPASVTLAAALATALREGGQAEEAAAVLANRLDVLERQTPPDAIMMGYLTAARLAVAIGEEQRAIDLLENLSALGEARLLPRLHVIALAEQLRMHATQYRSAACAVLEQRLDKAISALPPQQWGPAQALVDLQIGIAHVYAAIGHYGWQKALELLTALVPQAVQLHRTREAIQIHMLRALAMKYCKMDGETLLLEAVGLTQTLGLTQLLRETHPDLESWARQLQGKQAGGSFVQPPDSVQPANRPIVTTSRATVATGALLTPKEREVLELLAGNMSNKQIALAMDVSGETVKWHMKNLFEKLNAGTRKHLVDRARMLGILRDR